MEENKEEKNCPCCSGKHKERQEKEKKDLMNRLKRIEGQVRGIENMLEKDAYCTDVLIAKAVLPVQGKRASIIYHFDVQKTNTPTMKEDGSVDFHRLDMIERVEKGQLANHVKTCVADNIRQGNDEAIDELVTLLQKLMK